MLVAQDPAGNSYMLKYFYWNVIWEQTVKRDGAGNVVLDRATRLQQNVQHPVHSGNPRDPKFFGKEYDPTLPSVIPYHGGRPGSWRPLTGDKANGCELRK
jgi:hypothetical protein